MLSARSTKGISSESASIDEILSTIHDIIAEEPLSSRSRMNVTVRASENAAAHRRNFLTPAEKNGVRANARLRGVDAPKLHVSSDDDVLAELLADDVAAPQPARAASVVETVTATTDSDVAADEARTAALALDALAAGLAATASTASQAVSLVEASHKEEAVSAAQAEADVEPETAMAAATCERTVTAEVLPDHVVAPEVMAAPAAETTVAAAAVAAANTQALVPAQTQSFEDAIAGMLRPLLREWLNANLPRMVEKALREELADGSRLAAGASGHAA